MFCNTETTSKPVPSTPLLPTADGEDCQCVPRSRCSNSSTSDHGAGQIDLRYSILIHSIYFLHFCIFSGFAGCFGLVQGLELSKIGVWKVNQKSLMPTPIESYVLFKVLIKILGKNKALQIIVLLLNPIENGGELNLPVI